MTAKQPATDAGRRYRGADPAERAALRRARLVEAGITLFGTLGYPHTTLAMLSAESGVPHRYLTAIFPGREDLLREIYLGISQDVINAVLAARQAPATDPLAGLYRDVSVACAAFTADERRLRINCLEVVGVSPAFEQLRRSVIRDFCRLIVAGIEVQVAAGLLPARDDYHAAAIGLVGAFHELMTEWVLTPAPVRPPVAALTGQVQEFFRGMLLAVLNPPSH